MWGYRINTESIGYIYIDNPEGEHMSWKEVETTLNNLSEENKKLKNKIKNYEDESKFILIERNKDVELNYTHCDECLHYSRDYEEVIAFGEYETLTHESCSEGHYVDPFKTDCPDYIEK